jgi:hypothetical protein
LAIPAKSLLVYATTDPKPVFTKIFMHFFRTSAAVFGRIGLLDRAGPIDLATAHHRSGFHLPHREGLRSRN